MRRLFAMISVLAMAAGIQAAAPVGPRTVMVDSEGVLSSPTNFWSTNATGIATALAPWLGGGALTNVTLLTYGATNELLPNALRLVAGDNITLATNGLDLEITATITGGTGTVTHESGALTLNNPVLGNADSDLKSVDANTFRQAIGMEIGIDVQAYDADLADLSDGELSGSKIGEGIDAAHVTAGLLDVARLSSAVTLDNEWDTSAEILTALGDDKTGTGKLVFDQSPVLTTPHVDNLINMGHGHTNQQSGGVLGAGALDSSQTYSMAGLNAGSLDVTNKTGTGTPVYSVGASIDSPTITNPVFIGIGSLTNTNGIVIVAPTYLTNWFGLVRGTESDAYADWWLTNAGPLTLWKNISGTPEQVVQFDGTQMKVSTNILVDARAIQLGTGANASTNAQFIAARPLTDDNSLGNGHAFTDSSVVSGSGGRAWNSFDGRGGTTGTNDFDHYALFQALPTFDGTGILTNFYGAYLGGYVDGGIVLKREGIRVMPMSVSGGGTVGDNTGVRVDYLYEGTNNYAVLTGANPSGFGTFAPTNDFEIYRADGLDVMLRSGTTNSIVFKLVRGTEFDDIISDWTIRVETNGHFWLTREYEGARTEYIEADADSLNVLMPLQATILTAQTIVQGTDTLDDLLAAKAASDILDTSSVGALGTAGTNTVLSAFDNLLLRRTASYPATALEGGAVEIDWATEAVKAIVATNSLSITDANRPTNVFWVTGYGSITNSALSDISVAWPSGWTAVTGVEMEELASGYAAFISWTWDGSKVWYSYETRQTEPLSDAFGGTGRSSLTENKILAGAGTGPVQLLSVGQGLSIATNTLLSWDAYVINTHTNDDVVKLWEIAVPTNQSFHGYADVRSSGGAGGMLRHEAYGGFWRDADAGLAHAYTNSVSHGDTGGNAYWYTNANSAALYVVGIDSANWRTWAGIRYDLMDNPDVAAPTYNVLWSESFEGVGTENTYASTVGTQWDFDNTAQYAYGSQSAYHTNAAERHNLRTQTITNFTQSAMMSVRINTYPKADGALRLMLFGNSSSSYEAQFSITATGKLRATAWAQNATTDDSVPTNTWFTVWAEMVTDTTDAISMKAGWSADTTKPTSGTAKYASTSTTGRTFTPYRNLFPDVLNTAYDDGEVWIDGVLIIDGEYADLPGAFPE